MGRLLSLFEQDGTFWAPFTNLILSLVVLGSPTAPVQQHWSCAARKTALLLPHQKPGPLPACQAALPPTSTSICWITRSGTVTNLPPSTTVKGSSFPLISSIPPLQLHIYSNAKALAYQISAFVLLHWQEDLKEGLELDVCLGVLERVPLNTAVLWQFHMVCTTGRPLHN